MADEGKQAKIDRSGGLLCVSFHTLAGENTDSLTALDKAVMVAAEDDTVKTIIFDLAGVRFLSSASIGAMIGVYQRVKRHNGQVFLCNLSASVRKVFEMTKLTELLRVYDTVEDARAAHP